MAGARRLADEVRVGLGEEASVKSVANADARRKDPLNETWFDKPVRQHVREFGALFGAIGFFVTAVKLYQGRDASSYAAWLTAAVVFSALGFFAPRLLLPVWRGWMKLAHYLSIVMTTVILSLAWCIGFLPVAGMLKVLRIKPMDLSYRSSATTYWETRDPKYDDFKRLELQY
jgi:hypothetical protein